MSNRIIQQVNAQEAAQVAFEAEIRATARDIFSRLVAQYLSRAERPNPRSLREIADVAWKSAQYVYVPTGIVKVDDSKLWPPDSVRTIQ